jgi:secreted PhoX family phosphatase
MDYSRREFLMASSVSLLSIFALRTAIAQEVLSPLFLEHDPSLPMALPKGFSCSLLSKTGDVMDDGLLVAGKPDGMATFDMGDELIAIIRNHENEVDWFTQSPYGKDAALLANIDRAKLYDAGEGNNPALGGCSTMIYDMKQRKMVRQFMSLAGTERNCSGGRTPWGTWITAEESDKVPSARHKQYHGFAFEVKPTLEPLLQYPIPLKAMGRFMREAVVVDPASGVIYQTEDRENSLFYRFIPNVNDNLLAGGILQALVVHEKTQLDTSNWKERTVSVGDVLACEWVTLDDVEAPKDDLRLRGAERGAAKFARGEGMCLAGGSLFFVCSNGGANKQGQIWRYTPDSQGGTLELFMESPARAVMKNPDNICVGPYGQLFVCEDNLEGGNVKNRILMINEAGKPTVFAENMLNASEFSGVCFSPDGSTMFLNVMDSPGATYAITGDWKSLA